MDSHTIQIDYRLDLCLFSSMQNLNAATHNRHQAPYDECHDKKNAEYHNDNLTHFFVHELALRDVCAFLPSFFLVHHSETSLPRKFWGRRNPISCCSCCSCYSCNLVSLTNCPRYSWLLRCCCSERTKMRSNLPTREKIRVRSFSDSGVRCMEGSIVRHRRDRDMPKRAEMHFLSDRTGRERGVHRPRMQSQPSARYLTSRRE